MFKIKSILYFYFISIILARNTQQLGKHNEEIDPIIEPLELVLRSTDNEGIFYCNSGLEINKQRSQLIATIDNPIVTPPAFLLITQQTNSTTIKIRIKPNGYIGINRISCHWSDNVTDGQTADLIIGENPGVIQLKERCRAYDRRYVQCIFKAATIARAFQNGFPRLYTFKEMNFEPMYYRPIPTLVDIINNTELVFHFEPRERNIIQKKVSMTVNMTLRRFGSSEYRFNIEPLHTTKVDFQIENITNKQFTIRINHNNTGTISPRLCSGHISQVNNRNTWTGVQDIKETTEQKFLITRLRSSTQYEICLHCYYNTNDESFNEKICNRIQTVNGPKWYIIGSIIVAAVIVVVLIGITAGLVVFFRTRNVGSEIIIPLNGQYPTAPTPDEIPELRYTPELPEEHPLINHHDSELPTDHSTDADKYHRLEECMDELVNENKVSPDTIDLTRQSNPQ